MIPKHTTKPEDISLGIKIKSQHCLEPVPKISNIQSQNLGTKSQGQLWPRRKPMSLNDFWAKNNQNRKILYLLEFDETHRFWYPHVALNEWIDFSSRTIELRPSECRENISFCFSLPFLSLSIRFLFFPPPVCFPSFFFFFLLLSLYFLFLFSLIVSSLSFSLIFLFLHFLFSISHLDCINSMVQKWGKLPHTFLHCHLSSLPFFS